MEVYPANTMTFLNHYNVSEQQALWGAAVKHGNLKTLQYLKASKCKYRGDNHIAYCAVIHGQLHVLKWCQDNRMIFFDPILAHLAGLHGHLHILQWLHEYRRPWCYYTCRAAAEKGHFHVLQWCCENDLLDEHLCSWAAENGNVTLLKWFRENGCPWDERTCTTAARNGHLHVLQWCKENGCPWCDRFICATAVQYDQLHV